MKFETESTFLDFLNQREVNATWKTVKTKEIKFMGMSGNEKIIEMLPVLEDYKKQILAIASTVEIVSDEYNTLEASKETVSDDLPA